MKNSLRVPVTDPKRGYLAHKEVIDQVITNVLARGQYILGEEVAAFEASFAEFVGARAAVGVASGTDALALALRVHGIGRGDSVVTVSHTSVATVAAVELVGAVPVLADIEPAFYTLNPASLESALAGHLSGGVGNRPPIKAAIVVHLYGQPAAMSDIAAICARQGVLLIEDCGQAHGAGLNGRGVGNWGTAAFSFYPTKNLGAFGDGGAVTTNDPAVAEKIKMLREYGWRQRYVSEISGANSRLDELQAAVLRAKLPRLADDNRRRQKSLSPMTMHSAMLSRHQPAALAPITSFINMLCESQNGRRSKRPFDAEALERTCIIPCPYTCSRRTAIVFG